MCAEPSGASLDKQKCAAEGDHLPFACLAFLLVHVALLAAQLVPSLTEEWLPSWTKEQDR